MRTAFIVLMKDGSTQTYRLTDRPVITIQDRQLHIQSEVGDVLIPVGNIIRYTFERYDLTGVMDLREEEPEMEYRNSELVVTGLKVGTNVDIYDLSGKLVRHLESRRNGSYRLSLSDLSKGVYVVKVNQTTLKILKR